MTGLMLREWREAVGWTQEALAAKLYVSVSQVSRWETGRSGITGTRERQIRDLAKSAKVKFPR